MPVFFVFVYSLVSASQNKIIFIVLYCIIYNDYAINYYFIIYLNLLLYNYYLLYSLFFC